MNTSVLFYHISFIPS